MVSVWLVTSVVEFTDAAVLAATGVVVAYHTLLVAGSFVVHVTVAVVCVVVALSADITGAVVSGVVVPVPPAPPGPP